MTPKDNELRMQIGLVITHTNDELLFVRSEKNPNILDALQAFADLVRQDEREACAELATQKAKHIFDQAEIYAVGASETANAQATAWQLKVLADEIRAKGNHEST